MRRAIWILFANLIFTALWASQSQAGGLPVIHSTSVNFGNNTLAILGRNFGTRPTVALNNQMLTTRSSSSTQIVASFQPEAPATSYVPGTYILVVQFSNQLPALFTTTIGTAGPQQSLPGGVTPAEVTLALRSYLESYPVKTVAACERLRTSADDRA